MTDSTYQPPSVGFRFILALVLLAIGIGVAVFIVKTTPKPERKARTKTPRIVRARPLTRTDETVSLPAMGTVMPSKATDLTPQISGLIQEIDPGLEPGARYARGDILYRIDPTDYKLALEQRKADLAKAELNYKLELGRQEIAAREWKLLDQGKNTSALEKELTLRKPHLAEAKAALAGAKSRVRQAEINLERTRIRAPYDCIIESKSVDLGAQVTPQTPLVRVVNSSTFWITATVPATKLSWIRLPDREQKGSLVEVALQGGRNDVAWTGRVIQFLPGIETQGRLARILVAVDDPLGKQPPLLIGSYVRLSIQGIALRDVLAIARSSLRSNDTVWLATPDNKLAIRKAGILWRSKDQVYIRSGVEEGDRLITSDISAPVEGMTIQTDTKRDRSE